MNELTKDEIDRFLDAQKIGRLGCQDAGVIYVVPLIYAYARERNALYILTIEGQKARFARANPNVCFEVDEYDNATGNWQSVIVQGRCEELVGDGKNEAIAVLSARHGARRAPPPPSTTARPATVALRIDIVSVTGRSLTRT